MACAERFPPHEGGHGIHPVIPLRGALVVGLPDQCCSRANRASCSRSRAASVPSTSWRCGPQDGNRPSGKAIAGQFGRHERWVGGAQPVDRARHPPVHPEVRRDHAPHARRIAWLRGYYFDQAPELVGYLLSVAPAERLRVQGLGGGFWQGFLTVAGMVGVITAVLAGFAAGLLAGIVAGHSLVAALAVGAVIAIAALAALMRYQHLAWRHVISTPAFPGEEVMSK